MEPHEPTSAAPWPADRVKRAVATISFPDAAAAAPANADQAPFMRAVYDLFHPLP